MGITRVAIAGSTGSIGTQTLDYIAQSDCQFEVVGLGVGTSAQAVIAQAQQWKPKVVAVADEAARMEVAQALPGVEVVSDQSVLAELADVVVNGVVGFAGTPDCPAGGGTAGFEAGCVKSYNFPPISGNSNSFSNSEIFI